MSGSSSPTKDRKKKSKLTKKKDKEKSGSIPSLSSLCLHKIGSQSDHWRRKSLTSILLKSKQKGICYIQEKQIKYFISSHAHDVNLDYPIFLSDEGSQIVINKCQKTLQSLNLTSALQITKNGLSILLNHCTNLQSLNLSCTPISDTHLEAITNTIRNFEESSKPLALKHLILQTCTKITDKGMISILKSSLRLSTLNIWGCKNLTDLTLKSITTQTTLTSLDVGLIPFKDFSSIVSLKELKYLSLSNQDIIDSDLENIVRSCSKLSTLKAVNCNKLFQHYQCAFLLLLPSSIKYLDFSYSNFDDDCLKSVATKCSELDTLILKNCPDMTLRGISAFLEDKPQSLHRFDILNSGISSIEKSRLDSMFDLESMNFNWSYTAPSNNYSGYHY